MKLSLSKVLAATACGGLILLVTGCQTVPSKTPAAPTSAQAAPAFPSQITAAPGMDQWLKVGQITTSYNATNALTVSTPISVSGTAPRSLTYRFEWLDANGASILTTASRDFRTFVQPGAVETLRSVGPADSAVDFRLHLRSP